MVDEVPELVAAGYAELGVGAVQVRGDGAGGEEQPVGEPPAAWQSSRLLDSTQPWPLQAFWPLQALLADLQALWPLQALMPLQASDVSPNVGLPGVWAFAKDAKAPTATKAAAAAMTNDFFMQILPQD